MSQPGWYPNPNGGNDLRYWDGTQWRDEAPRSRSSSLAWVLGGVLLIGTIVAILVLQPRGFSAGTQPGQEDTRSYRPSVTPWDERSNDPSNPSSEEEDSGTRSKECPEVGSPYSEIASDGRMHGGGVSIVAPTASGWYSSTTYMPWMSDQNSRVLSIVQGWVASVDVGAVRVEDGFVNPKQAAKAMLSCMASSWMYESIDYDEILMDEEFSLDGNSGWYVKANVYVNREDGILGDVLDIYVLDIGREGELSVVVGCATINHEKSIQDVTTALSTLRVD